MHPNDLLKLLDLEGKPPDIPSGATTIVRSVDAPQPQQDTSPTALHVDAWGLRRGRDLITESERLRKSQTDEFAAADFFTAAFDPDPQLLPACMDVPRREFLAQLLETPDYKSLHASTRFDDTAAAIAATHFAEQFTRLKEEDPSAGSRPSDEIGKEMATLRAVGRALAEAGKEVDDFKEATAALGMGPGSPGSNDPHAVAALFKRVRSDPALRRICELAGRFRRVAQSKQRRKTTHGLDDVVGVTLGGEMGRLLPQELVKLASSEFEEEVLRRLVEKQCLCREHRAVEPVGKGPIVIVIDESGSMEGDKAHTAKALALALAWIARRQRRWCGLIAFSGDSGHRLLALPPGRWNEAALCDWLAAFIGCGSSLDVPIKEMPEFYRQIGAPAGATDLIFVTDAQCRIDRGEQDRFNAWRRSVQARLTTLVIDHPPGDLSGVSDDVFQVAALDPADERVGRVLSL